MSNVCCNVVLKPKLSIFVLLSLAIIMFDQIPVVASYNIPKELIDHMATRQMRYHHFLWHNVRNLWNKLDNSTQERLIELSWAPPRPALRYDENGLWYRMEDNNSGEDFLFMHRQMIIEANAILNKSSPPTKVHGFRTIPAPGDQNYPEMPIYSIPGSDNLNKKIADQKSADFYWQKIKPAETNFTDPQYLRSLTLGQLGSRIEFTIHNWLHTRFSQNISATRPSSSDVMPYVDEIWDAPAYNWLQDPYASHVHPWFWKIHGWVDDRIEDWRKANNVTQIQWKGTWMGGPFSSISELLETDSKGYAGQDPHDHMHMSRMMQKEQKIEDMEEVVRILMDTGECFYYSCYTE